MKKFTYILFLVQLGYLVEFHYYLGTFIFFYSIGNYSSNGTVSHAGHLGGLVAGLMMFVAKKGRF
jgi:membrane associated rhomboid family serine protease